MRRLNPHKSLRKIQKSWLKEHCTIGNKNPSYETQKDVYMYIVAVI